ncbi:hypothetical protein GLOTRDRAFT_136023 [Gloeophyllum trabeum ATCC 11539]|uniref:Protein YOP1 n=1 Tax=Gloeophyllum trabeum (strain ATCC 11539 / FP-39264 / Madison 617) TaxID=670483 RepID=S7S026_GLOTA|nr:uncharacterized protein GLOTRDRAFT_136023 [Gloeophyllum trabeum ATCC 11539]EPQ59039.1 hypothetical protein GLOTRDRAFT_136023 [Gloeophyllum trabeum ATCC 11539]
MPLIVPALRLTVLFMNVWETFKTVKPPRPSSRNNGQPSARAMTQRKRNMKGCLAVWVVWCCFALYEATLDGIVGIFIPFYDEIKALLLLFLLLARAKGAEPIYLHVLRPLLKPYVPLLDSMLEVTALFGGFFIMLASIPVQYVMSWWKGTTTSLYFEATPQPDNLSDVSSLSLNGYDAGGTEPIQQSRVPSREGDGGRPPYSRNNTIRPSRGQPAVYPTGNSRGAASSGSTNGQAYSYPRTSSSASSTSQQIWHPPPSAYDDNHPPAGMPGTDGAPSEVDHVEEWRQYPPFPSAYPATPVATSAKLHGNSVGTKPDPSGIVPEDEEWRKYPPFPSAYPATPLNTQPKLPSLVAAMQGTQGIPEEEIDGASHEPYQRPRQGFERSLKQPQNAPPSSDGSLSDNAEMIGVQEYNNFSDHPAESQEETMVSDGSSDDGEYHIEEDSFDISFTTPRVGKIAGAKDDPQATVTRRQTRRPMSVALTESSSYHSQSTNLSTTDNGSSLRTAISRSPSESSVSSTFSDTGSVAGRKRTRALNDHSSGLNTESEDDLAEETIRPRALNKKTSSKSASRLRPPTSRTRPKMPSALLTDAEGDDELNPTDSDESAADSVVKRRKVVASSGETKPVQERRKGLRPRTTSQASQRESRVAAPSRPRKRPVSQATVARKPSSSVLTRRTKSGQEVSNGAQKTDGPRVWK